MARALFTLQKVIIQKLFWMRLWQNDALPFTVCAHLYHFGATFISDGLRRFLLIFWVYLRRRLEEVAWISQDLGVNILPEFIPTPR